jgi:WS/DGAT/MGAT family acyltransferase
MIGKLALPLGKALLGRARELLAERRLGSVRGLLKLAPRTPFNVSITNQRVFAAVSLPLAEAKALGKAHGASVNDTVLWLCATALREYLRDSRELPEASLVAGVPVSLREEGDTRMNNQVTMSLIDLGSQIADPLERLAAIKAATASMKNQMGVFGELIPTDFPSLGAPWLLAGLVSLYGRSGLADRIRVANVTISNVPGAQVPLYLAGARMLDYYPVSIVVHGVALNITVQSYMGQLCFGLIACRRAVPDVRDIADGLGRALDSFRKLVPAAAEAPAAAAVAADAAPKATAARAARPRRAEPAAGSAAPKRPALRVVAKAPKPPKPPVRARAARQAKA